MSTEINPVVKMLQDLRGKHFNNSPSPFTLWLNPIVVDAAEGEVTLMYEVRHDMTNPLKTLHGGVIAGIMDDAIGATVFSLGLKDFYTTVNLQVDFFAPAVEGDSIQARTWITKRGRQIIHAECHLTATESGKILAKGASNLIRLERKMKTD